MLCCMGIQSIDSPVTVPDAEDEALALITAAAEATLAAWPQARAAVLFGSRARGDHRPDSDWDVAFVTMDAGDRIRPLPEGLPAAGLPSSVQCLAVPETLLVRRCGSIGDVVRGVVRDGRLLAGSWDRPGLEGLVSTMGPDEYARLINGAITALRNASTHAALLASTGEWTTDVGECNGFAKESVTVSEYIAKAMLGRHGVDYRKVHDLDQLGKGAERAGYPDLAAVLRSLNGKAAEHHLAQYEGVDADDCRHAVRRLLAATPLLAAELQAGAATPRFVDLARRLARPAAFTAREGAASLRMALSRDLAPYPEDDEHAPPNAALAIIRILMDARPGLACALEDIAATLGDDENEPPPPSFGM